MHIDFRKNKTVIPPTTLGEQSRTKVRSYKLLVSGSTMTLNGKQTLSASQKRQLRDYTL